MPIDFSKLFLSLGLSETETKVYFASLKLGPTSVQEIAKKARLSRTATYDAVAALQDRGLMSTFERGKKRYFAVEEPERAVGYFRDQVGKMNRQLEALEDAVPELSLLAGGEKPSVRFYEGKEAIVALFHDVESVKPSFRYEMANYDDVYEHLDMKMLEDLRRRIKLPKMDSKMLFCGKLRQVNDRAEYYRLPESLGEFHGDVWIYKNRVAFINFIGKAVTIIVESELFANMARAMFDAAVMSSERVTKPDIVDDTE